VQILAIDDDSSAALAVAAGMSVGRSPFMKIDIFRKRQFGANDDSDETMEEQSKRLVIEHRNKLFKSVGKSDVAMLAAAFLQWETVPGGFKQNKIFCDSLGLSIQGMRDMKQLTRQLDSSLSVVGYHASQEADANSKSWKIIRSCIVSSLSPSQIVRVLRPSTKFTETIEGAVEKGGVAKELKFFIRGKQMPNVDDKTNESNLITRYHNIVEERVFVHPASASFAIGSYSCPWLVYNQLVRTSKSFLRDATECSSYALLLFGGNLEIQAANGLIVVDNYVRFAANARIGTLIGALRSRVDLLLSQKIQNPSLDLAKSAEMRLIVKLLISDGLG